MVIWLFEVDSAGDLRVHRRAPQFFGGVFLADGGFDQRRAGEKKAAAFGHQHVIRHHWQIRAARHAHAHNGGDLRDAHSGHARVVAEDATEVILVGEDILLQRQEDAGGVDKVKRRDAVLHGDVLRAQHLLRGHGKECAGLHCGVVGDDHAQTSADPTQSADDASSGSSAPLVIHAKPRIRTQLEKFGVRVEQQRQPLSRSQPLLGVLRLNGLGAATLADGGLLLTHSAEQRQHAGSVRPLPFCLGIELRGDCGVQHGRCRSRRRSVRAGHRKLVSIAAWSAGLGAYG